MRESSYLLNNLRSFDEIFRKDVTYDNIKSHKKARFHPLFRMYIFRKNTRGIRLNPLPTFLGLNIHFLPKPTLYDVSSQNSPLHKILFKYFFLACRYSLFAKLKHGALIPMTGQTVTAILLELLTKFDGFC